MPSSAIQSISVIVPKSPFAPTDLSDVKHCLTALDVAKLMEWWPGTPHSPHRKADKVQAIQRSLDWKRVAQIAAYLLQQEITDAPEKIIKYFKIYYAPKLQEPGREWPPRIPKVIGYSRSEYPTFSNVLLHVNGAKIKAIPGADSKEAAKLEFTEIDKDLNFSVIDGQHRINGAYLAISILRETSKDKCWEIPAEIFLDLDKAGDPPRKQAQIFIDVNFHQKKVDRSLVTDLYPTARSDRDSFGVKERAQDIGRKLMLETGPLVGMVQIPGIRFGSKDVITLATLAKAVEDLLDTLINSGIESLTAQTLFIAQCLTAWLTASGRAVDQNRSTEIEDDNVVYQGRCLTSFLSLVPACLLEIKRSGKLLISSESERLCTDWLRNVLHRARLLDGDTFISKGEFKKKGYLGSGGIARFKDSLWAAAGESRQLSAVISDDALAKKAAECRDKVARDLGK